MFKRYDMEWKGLDGRKNTVSFFVHSRKTRKGFVVRACALGHLPRLDEKGNDWEKYKDNDRKLRRKRTAKSRGGSTWEHYLGQSCLAKLWNQLAGLRFMDMSQICRVNPFEGDAQPECVTLCDPEDLFGAERTEEQNETISEENVTWTLK